MSSRKVRNFAWQLNIRVDDLLLSLDDFLWIVFLFGLDDRLEPVAVLFCVFLLVSINEGHQVDRADFHEDDLALFCTTACAFIVFNDLAFTEVHRREVVLSADLNIFFTLSFE